MNGITARCVSLGRGDKDPLERVNYEFGLVLGVDEFVAEQYYFLEKEYMTNRALHGYGTVSGLNVSAVANAGDLEIRVAAGIGIDQYGRMFVVSQEQCASILTWLENQQLGAGDHTIYVTARYDECKTALVPIAGQPCSSSDDLTAASRIKDVFDIAFTLEPPPQPAFEAVINLAEFLHRLRIDPALEDSTADALRERLVTTIGPSVILSARADYVELVTQLARDITGQDDARLIPVLPQDAEDLLQDIFAYWVTLVRPALLPDLIDPDIPLSSETGAEPHPPEIVLAQVDLTVPGDGPLTLDGIAVDNSIRPTLLHTQLIQELFAIPQMPGEGGEVTPAQPVREFASIADINARQMGLWLHINENIVLESLQNGLRIIRLGTTGALNQLNFRIAEDADRRNEVGRYYQIRTNANLADGDYLVFLFNTADITLERGAGRPVTLRQFIETAPFTYSNLVPASGEIAAYHIVHRAQGGLSEDQVREIVSALIPDANPVAPFVTITPLTASDGEFDFLQGYELWFHFDGFAEQNISAINNLNADNLPLLAEDPGGAVRRVGFQARQTRPNVWIVRPDLANQGLPFARFVFGLDADYGIQSVDPSGNQTRFSTLREYAKATNQQLAGHPITSEAVGDALVVYVREQGRARGER